MWHLVLHFYYLTAIGKAGIAMNGSNSFSHLTLEERRIILAGITNGSSKTAIAQTIGKDKSTIGKEIRLHRSLTHKCKMPLECSNYRKCVHGRHCTLDCPEYVPFKCSRRDRSPRACNGCSNWSKCRFDKYQYCPENAHHKYKVTLTDSREGVNLTVSEAKSMAQVIAPLLKQGLSPFQILAAHLELNISEKTLYNYIENDVFHEIAGITVLDLRRQVSRKRPKKALTNTKSGLTVNISRAVHTRTTKNTLLNIPMFSLPRWIPFITMRQMDRSFKPSSLWILVCSLLSSIIPKLLLP